MGSSSNDNHTMQLITKCSLFSCTYMFLYMFILYYNQSLYNIGKRNCMPLIAGITFAECVKVLLVYVTRDSANPRDKSNKTKKINTKNVFKSILTILTTIVAYYITAVLFGAPFTSQQEETLMFSLLLATLTVLPSCLNLGVDTSLAILTGSTVQRDLITDTVKRSIYLTLFGAWLGAVVIPLDWDRPWQVWPIPCSFGAMAGYMCSHMIALINLLPRFSKLFVKKTGKYGL